MARLDGRALRSAVLRGLYRGGWRVAAAVPRPLVQAAIGISSRGASAAGGPHVENLRRNLTVVIGGPAPDGLVRAAVASHLRNVYETLALPRWSPAEVVARVTTSGEARVRTVAADRGAVLALPHSGNWDLAGAWASATGLRVSTVAEQLAGPEFAAFLRFREGLGMEVWSHRDPAVMTHLVGAVRRGRTVCLLADRDLAGRGLAVRWGPATVTLPAGPAMLARRTGAVLVPVVSTFTARGMHLDFGEPIEPVPGADGLAIMTQQVASAFSARIAERPQDWHMLQPFFPGAGGEVGR
jgi:KDO2-lipid IV(A) lauroyltransferase